MGGSSSREIIESSEKRIQDLEKRVLELEQRVFLGATKDSKGNLIFDTVLHRYNNTPTSSIDTEVDDIYTEFLRSKNTNTVIHR